MLRFLRRDARPLTAAAQSALRPYTGVLAELLYARGVDTAAEAERFLHPSLSDLRDPFALKGMAEAVTLIKQAKDEGWPTVVYGDYDADGVCAAALMTEALRRYGIAAEPHVPLRSEGYGLNVAAVEKLAETYRLMITVDLGITNAAEVTRARELGLTVIVTDHHQPGLTPCPADVVIDPLLGDYPFPKLCGAGVAYKVACALHGAENAAEWLNLAALATVADIVPLLDENRVIVANGLQRFGDRPGLCALAEAAGSRVPPDAETVAYQFAPRLNAAGRLGDAGDGVRLLLTRDSAEATALAAKLDGANARRKKLEAETTAQAELQAETHDFMEKRVLFVRGENWHAGVVGLVAGRLNRRYGVPVCAMSEQYGLLHGSLRGVRGVNLARCLQTCDDLLLRYGGHEMAAGVTLKTENDEAFRARLEHAVRISADEQAFVPVQVYDAPLSLREASDALLTALAGLEPFGMGNPAPVFYTQEAQLVRRRACGAQGAHLQVTLRDGGGMLSGIAFGMGAQAPQLTDTVDAAYTLTRDTYMGRETVKCYVQALHSPTKAQAALLETEPATAFDFALLDAVRASLAAFPGEMAGNGEANAELIKAIPDADNPADAFPVLTTSGGETRSAESLCEGRQGTLFVAYARETAKRFLAAFGDRVELARGAADDPRCFHTLLIEPTPEALRGHWKAVALLDGPLTPAEPGLWRRLLPEAAVYTAPSSPAVGEAAVAVDAGDERYRVLYRRLHSGAYADLRQAAQAAQMTEPQALAGLYAFQALGLVSFSPAPFHYDFCEPNKCSLSDSPVLGALRALAARMEARKC